MSDLGTGALAAGNVIGGLIGARGASRAADAQQAATEAAIAEQRRQFDISREDIAPWRTAGLNALNRLEMLLGTGQTPDVQTAQAAVDEAQANLNRLSQGGGGVPSQFIEAQIRSILGPSPVASGDSADPEGRRRWKRDAEQLRASLSRGGQADPAQIQQAQARLDQARNALAQAQTAPAGEDYGSLLRRFTEADFEKAPGYDFRIGEGQKALERSAAARGGLLSGAAGKALTRYGQEFGSEEFMNAFNRDQAEKARIYNMLAGVSGTGQTAAGQLVSAGQATGANISNLLTQGGNAAAAGRVGVANALSGGVQNIADYYALQNLLNPNQRRATWSAPPVNRPGGWT